jgi:Uma2 family endonuclease
MLELENVENDEVQENKVQNMPSFKHSLTQTRIATLLSNDDRLTTFVELSLDASQVDLSQFGIKAKDELIPDVCVYLEPPFESDDEIDDDVLKVSQIPDLVIEVLSPKQTISELLNKFKAYFALGVKSCWLAVPSIEVIKIYSPGNQYRTFSLDSQEMTDEAMNIRLPIQKVFQKRLRKRSKDVVQNNP